MYGQCDARAGATRLAEAGHLEGTRAEELTIKEQEKKKTKKMKREKGTDKTRKGTHKNEEKKKTKDYWQRIEGITPSTHRPAISGYTYLSGRIPV